MKVLIWIEKLESRRGGPTTYLYNLKESVLASGLSDKIAFLADYRIGGNNTSPAQSATPATTGGLRHLLKTSVPERVRANIAGVKFLKHLRHLMSQPLPYKVDLNEFDVIHFHSTLDLYKNYQHLKDFKGKIYLTTHCPKAPHLEIIEDELKTTVNYFNFGLYDKFEHIDKFAFDKADKLIFPCQEALEPYYNTWPAFADAIKGKKISYVPTATGAPQIKRSTDEVREQYHIPEDAFVVVYAGRHNEVKGYSNLKAFGAKALEKYPNVYFLIAGKEEPLTGLKHDRWIEVGWTNDPHSVIKAGNLFVLPNNETYFDLIALEVLALGQFMLMSNVGGNKYFKKFNDIGIRYFDKKDINGMMTQLDEIINTPTAERQRLGHNNAELYAREFSFAHFANNYYKAVIE